MTESLALLLRPTIESEKFRHFHALLREIGVTRSWLLGGMVLRPLVHAFYGVPIVVRDYDFLVEEYDLSRIPSNWSMTKNSYGSPKFFSQHGTVDVSAIGNFHSVKVQGLPPTVENVLFGSPLNVQSIAYDFDQGVVLGEAGIRSLEERVVKIHNPECALAYGRRGFSSLHEIIRRKAESLGFLPDYSGCPPSISGFLDALRGRNLYKRSAVPRNLP